MWSSILSRRSTSLAGSLTEYTERRFPTDEELETAIDDAWAGAVREQHAS
jgi:hypothetical protein